jgi:hypothetical protein
MMRTTALTLMFLGLLATPTFAITHGGGGGKNKYTALNAVNNADAAVDVSVNGGYPVTLEPLQAYAFNFYIDTGNKIAVTVTASLTASPQVSATGSASLQSGKNATATITSPTPSTLAIAFDGASGKSARLGRESGVMLASSGGLLPLLWLGFLLGGKPRRNKSSLAVEAHGGCSGVQDPEI